MPDMFLLDIMLPDISGIEVIKYIRKKNKEVPIMVVSALNSEIDKVKALDLGADDYLTKPFGVLELTSRIYAHLRRVEKSETYEKGNLRLDIDKHVCYINDTEIKLTNKEFDILLLLFKNDGKVVKKEVIFEEVWQIKSDVETRTLDMHIKSLRQKIESSNIHIKTVRGVGYQIEDKD
ncbi:putative two-component system, response regulator) [Alteracholeplasma palmae J233]|uniref:Putative two-component system, response regulator n=1 Tax=Alteracholeplasma palmae (strain ATCC 49389 / J233) TaxID=1318466 RepID=U4KJN9_ALTPJ|nr:putative two-component system, response regulator) [Alteracholeplasma palmae J233]